MIHYNIAQKTEINPFEKVKWIVVSVQTPDLCEHPLYKFLSEHSEKVETRKINNVWNILFDIQLMDFTVLLHWYDTTRGKFNMAVKSKNSSHIMNKSIDFRVMDDLMICW